MTRTYFELNQEQFIEMQSNDAALQQYIESLESALRYIRDELTRWHFTTAFDHLLDRIDAVLPGQLAQGVTEWIDMYDKRVVLVRHADGGIEVDPEFAKEQHDNLTS